MIRWRALVTRLAPLLASLGLLVVWQLASLALKNDSFPTALESIRAIPSLLADPETLISWMTALLHAIQEAPVAL